MIACRIGSVRYPPVVPPLLANLIGEYGYGLIGLLVLLVNVGVPVPGHAAYFGACAIAATAGKLELPIGFAVGATAAFLGAWFGFYLGQRGGRELVEKLGPRVGLSTPRLASME